MLSIPEKNEEIYLVVYRAITYKSMNNLTEFGFFDYIIYPIFESNKICMAFRAPGFKEILDYSGRQFLKEEFKDYTFDEFLVYRNYLNLILYLFSIIKEY
jgi:hypothetical protein